MARSLVRHLGASVRDFIQRAKERPGDASDPRLLDQLARDADAAWDGAFAATHAPMAPLSWEIKARLLKAEQETERISLPLPGPMEIVGFYGAISPVDHETDSGLRELTRDDIDVAMDVNGKERLTSSYGITSATGGRNGAFVTLGALHVNAPRLLGLRLEEAKPDLGFVFRRKSTTPDWMDAYISLTLFARELALRPCSAAWASSPNWS
jgi:hypothetical protein